MSLADLIALAGETVEETLNKLIAGEQADLAKLSREEIDALTDAQARDIAARVRLCAALAIATRAEHQEFLPTHRLPYLRLLRFALEHADHLDKVVRTILLHSLRRFLNDRRAEPVLKMLQWHREDVVNGILLEEGQVRTAFRELRYTHRFVDDWYLRDRMDQALQQAIVTKLPEPGKARTLEEAGVQEMRRAVQRRWWAYLIITLAALLGGSAAAARWETIRPWLAWGLYLLVIAGLLWGAYMLCRRRVNPLRRLMPRLTASLAVGYAALALTEEAWSFPLTASPSAWVLASLVAVLASALYLFRHTSERLEDRELALQRSLFLQLQTLTTSLVIGIFVTAFFGYTSVPPGVLKLAQRSRWLGLPRAILLPAPFVAASGWHLTLLPEVTLFFACMALFIGVFLQLLWEREPVTEPLT